MLTNVESRRFPKLGKNWFAFCLFSLKVVELVERGTVALEVPNWKLNSNSFSAIVLHGWVAQMQKSS